MENVSPEDSHSGGSNNVHPPVPPSQTLPPQIVGTPHNTPPFKALQMPEAKGEDIMSADELPMFIGVEKLLLVLRDGRKLIGVLRSWDQFANLVLQDTIERIFVRDLYADIPRGIFLVRGENVLLLGEIDLDKDEYIPEQYSQASPEEVHALSTKEGQDRKRLDKITQTKMQELGFEVENIGEVLL